MAVEILSNNEGELDCHTCDQKMREERGHDREGIVTFWIKGKPIKRCPLTLITPLSYEWIKAFGFYENGFLPNGKAWQEESNRFIQAMMILTNEFNRWRGKEPENKKHKVKDRK